jgi:hypothetical protein
MSVIMRARAVLAFQCWLVLSALVASYFPDRSRVAIASPIDLPPDGSRAVLRQFPSFFPVPGEPFPGADLISH